MQCLLNLNVVTYIEKLISTSFKIVKFTIYCTLRCPHFDWAVGGGLVWQVRSGFKRLAHRIGKSDSSCGV